MKVAIITFHKSYNYGSVLQAYALQTYIENLGCKVNIIDYVFERDFRQYKLFRTYLYKIHPKAFLRDLKRFPRNLRRKKNFHKFANKFYKLTSNRYNDRNLKKLNKEFDCFICGSDQIWNLDCTGGPVPAFFLNFVEKGKKKIAYAPSVAHANFEGNSEQISNYLDSFNAISVREKTTIQEVKKYTKNDIICTIDPTLLLTKDDYKKIEKINKCQNKYIFYYHLEDNLFMKKWCADFAKKNKMSVIYIYKDNISLFENSQNVYGCSPESFIGYIHNAEYIVTNSFHATVFSIIFQKKFVTFKTKNSAARMVDFLNSLNLNERIYNDGFKMEQDIDYKNVEQCLSEYKKVSEIFIRRNLG